MGILKEYEPLAFEEIMELTKREQILNVAYDFMTYLQHGGTAFYASSIESAREELVKQFDEHRTAIMAEDISTLQMYREIVRDGINRFNTKRDIDEAKRTLKKLEKKKTFVTDTSRWIEQLKKVDIGRLVYTENPDSEMKSELDVIIHDMAELSRMYEYSKDMYPYLRHQTSGGDSDPIILNSKFKFIALFYENYARRLWESMQNGCLMDIPKEYHSLDLKLEKMYEDLSKIKPDTLVISRLGEGKDSGFCMVRMPKEMREGELKRYSMDDGEIMYAAPVPGFTVWIDQKYDYINAQYSDKKNWFSDRLVPVEGNEEQEIRKAVSELDRQKMMFTDIPKTMKHITLGHDYSYDDGVPRLVDMIKLHHPL